MKMKLCPTGWVPFNGMARRPWLEFWGLIFTIIVWITGCILLTISCFTYSTTDDTQYIQTAFADYSIDKDTLCLINENREVFFVYNYIHYEGTFEDPGRLCNGELFTLYVDSENNIINMSDSAGHLYVSPLLEREAYRRSQMVAIIALPSALLLTTGYLILLLCIGHNPEKYPNWLVRLVFEEGIFR